MYKILVTLKEGEVPILLISDRKWNDDSIAVSVWLGHQQEVTFPATFVIICLCFLQKKHDGQTFCVRTKFTAFMSDASNIMSFYGEVNVKGSVGYSVELWIFKPQPTGQQVINTWQIIYKTCIFD